MSKLTSDPVQPVITARIVKPSRLSAMLFFFSTKFPEEETGQDSLIVPALPPSHESQESQRKKLQEELAVTLLVCAVDPYSLGSH